MASVAPLELTFKGIIQTVDVRPGDVLVISCEQVMTSAGSQALAEKLHELFPGTRLLLLDGGGRLSVARPN